jgi:hypothetical protein
MRYRLILPLAALLTALIAVPTAQAKPRVGMSEQSPAMFDQANWQKLKLKRVRYILPWDYYKQPHDQAEVSHFMNTARAYRQEVLVTFSARRGCFSNGRYSKRKACRAPSKRAYQRAVRRFRKEFKWAKTFTPWNEVNHVSQPTHRKPRLAARYYLALRAVCKRCKVMAADVLDSSNVRSYLRRFLRATKGRGRIWGLHNYKDVNRRQSKGVRTVLRTVRGQVWLTETGGIVKFGRDFKYSERRAASRTKYMFKLTRRYNRLKRIYVYRWFGEPRSARFDAGLVDPDGSPRPAFNTFRRSIKRLPR